MKRQISAVMILFLTVVCQTDGDASTIINTLKTVIEAAKTARNIWDYVKDFPPTFADYLIKLTSKLNNNVDSAPISRSSYDFVVDLTRPSDIFSALKAYPLTFPLGKENYDRKIKNDSEQISRFIVNVVGRYNTGKTYILHLLANVNFGHSFVERTNGLSVSLPLLSKTQKAPMALIDTAGTRTPVAYHDSEFKQKSYERQDKGLKEEHIKQKLLIVHNYFNLHKVAQVEATEQSELVKLFGARKQSQGYWLSEHFKHFVIAYNGSPAGDAYNSRSIGEIRTMIKGSSAAKHNDVLGMIVKQIELLLSKVLFEELPPPSTSGTKHNNEDSGKWDLFARASHFVAAMLLSPEENRLDISNKRHINVELEVKQLSMDKIPSLWFICPKHILAENIKLSRNLKFAEDGSVHIDYSSQFIPDVHIFKLNERGDIQIRVECPSCENSYNVTVVGPSIVISGEKKSNIERTNHEYFKTNRMGQFEIQVPIGQMESRSTFDYRKSAIKIVYEHGVIVVTIPNITSEL